MNISVIIPVHNSALYLEECVESVLQDLNPEDEIILIENGSTDESWKMCKRYGAKYSNIHAVHLDTAGVSEARNKGLALARGYWVVFLDSDDIMAPSFLSSARKVNPDIDIALYEFRYLDNIGEMTKNDIEECITVDPILLRRGALQFGKYKKELKKKTDQDNITIWSCCAKLIRRKMIRENHIHFPKKLCLSEDTAFSLQLYCSAVRVSSINQISFFYRCTPQSATRQRHPRMLENNQYLRRWIYQYIKKTGHYRELEKELSTFLCRKFVEECIYLRESNDSRESKVQYIKDTISEPYMARAIKRAGYKYLVPGKKKTIMYGIIFWMIKRGMYGLLFWGS